MKKGFSKQFAWLSYAFIGILEYDAPTRRASHISPSEIPAHFIIYHRPYGLILSDFFIDSENYVQSYKDILIIGDFYVNIY